jgi:hypothetical protein
MQQQVDSRPLQIRGLLVQLLLHMRQQLFLILDLQI